MGFKFRKSVKIAPGVKLNLNKKSAGITIGGKGAHYTVNSKGKRTTSVGVPGTGVSYSSSKGGGKTKSNKSSGSSGSSIGCAGAIFCFIIFAFVMAGIKFLIANPKIGITVLCITVLLIALGIFLIVKNNKKKQLAQIAEAEAAEAAEAEKRAEEEKHIHATLKKCYSPEIQTVLRRVYRNKHSESFKTDFSFEKCDDYDEPAAKVYLNDEYIGIISDGAEKLLNNLNSIESCLFDVRSRTEDGEQFYDATFHITIK